MYIADDYEAVSRVARAGVWEVFPGEVDDFDAVCEGGLGIETELAV